MKKYIKNLEDRVSSVLNESLVTDAAELVGIEEQDAEDRIKGLSFANYIELGNAIDLEDAETVREILSTVAPIEETSGAGGTGAGAVGGGDIGTWDGKAHKKPKKGLKNSGKGIYEDGSGELYHVTHTKYVPNIQKNGIRPMGAASNWVQQGSGERYGMGEIYVFTNREDAKKWAGRMDWDFNQTLGSGNISIITLRQPADQDFEKDEADPMSQAGQQGEWLKTYEPISPENIVSVDAYDPKMESVNEEDTECDLKLLDQPTLSVREIADKHDVPMSDIASELAMGIKVELEHTKDRKIAKEIALDHLMELPDYYTRLKKMENEGELDEVAGAVLGLARTAGGALTKAAQKIGGAVAKGAKAYANDKAKDYVLSKEKEAMSEADNPYASSPSQGSSIDALAKQSTGDDNTMADPNVQSKDVEDLMVGDPIEVIDIDGDPTPVKVKNPKAPGDTIIVQTDKGEEHIVKKQAVSGTPTIQEMYESALETYEGRDPWLPDTPIPDKFYSKKTGKLIKSKAYYDWIESQKKVNEEEITYESALTDRIAEGWIEDMEAEDAETLKFNFSEWADLGFKKDRNWPGGTTLVALKDLRKEARAKFKLEGWQKDEGGWWIHPDKEFMSTIEFQRGVTTVTSMPVPSYFKEARNATNTEHSGAKKGKGGYYGRKKDAKSDSNKKRRANDKKAVDEKFDHYGSDARFIPVEFMGKEVGVVWQEGEGDWHAEVSATGASWGMIDSYKDAVELVQDEAAELVNEGFDPATHVNVEYRDPEGKFIVVHVPPAGYWAVGKGQYQHEIDRTAFDNFDDALDHAHQCLASLDEGFDLSEIRRLAGLKETASAGATGAGAIATAPTAMGGDPIRRSIYDKPKPKKRTKESSDDGIGRTKKK